MKVLAFNGSPKKHGCTYTALKLATDELEAQGIGTEIMHVGGSLLHGCADCRHCGKAGLCVYDDDMVNECIRKAREADGILLGSPVYFSGIAGAMKCFMDRFFFAGGDFLEYKIGAAVVSLRRSGAVDTFHQMNNYLNIRKVVIVPSQYWNAVHGNTPEEVMQDKEGVQIMQMLGRNMAWLLSLKENGKDTVFLPEKMPRVSTNFIR